MDCEARLHLAGNDAAGGAARAGRGSRCRCCFPMAPCCSATGRCRYGAGRRRARRSKSRSTAAASGPRPPPMAAWRVELPAHAAGGPYLLKVREHGGDTTTVRDVLVGDVWLASGQSNMEWPVAQAQGRRAGNRARTRCRHPPLQGAQVVVGRTRGATHRRRMAGGIAADGRPVLRRRLLLRARTARPQRRRADRHHRQHLGRQPHRDLDGCGVARCRRRGDGGEGARRARRRRSCAGSDVQAPGALARGRGRHVVEGCRFRRPRLGHDPRARAVGNHGLQAWTGWPGIAPPSR